MALTKKRAKGLAKGLLELAKGNLVDCAKNGEDFMNVVMLFDGDGDPCAPPLPFTFANDTEKSVKISLLRKLCKKMDVRMLVMINDVFYTRYETDQDMSEIPRPMDDPKRVEALTIMYEVKTKGGFTNGNIMSPYSRDGKKIEFIDNKTIHRVEDCTEMQGRMVGILEMPTNVRENYEAGDTCPHGNSWHSNCFDCETDANIDHLVSEKKDKN
jgi:hypothetical protein